MRPPEPVSSCLPRRSRAALSWRNFFSAFGFDAQHLPSGQEGRR